jgi:hypothetical protein
VCCSKQGWDTRQDLHHTYVTFTHQCRCCQLTSVAENYLFFYKEGGVDVSIPFRLVSGVRKDGKSLVIQTTDGIQHTFNSFFSIGKRDEALYLCLHLWEEPFSIQTDPPGSRPLDAEIDEPFVSSNTTTKNKSPRDGASIAPSPLVDVTSGRAALDKAHRAQVGTCICVVVIWSFLLCYGCSCTYFF